MHLVVIAVTATHTHALLVSRFFLFKFLRSESRFRLLISYLQLYFVAAVIIFLLLLIQDLLGVQIK